MSSLTDILTSLQNGVQAVQTLAGETAKGFPAVTSGQLAADTLVQNGFVRVLGIAVVAGGSAAGGLYDAATIAGAGSGQKVFNIATTAAAYTAVNLVFANGLVYKPGSGQIVTLFYRRT